MIQINRIANQTTPLCFLPDGRLVSYHHGRIRVFSDDEEELSFPIPMSGKDRLLGWSKLVTRLLRLGVRGAVALDNEHIILSIGNTLYEVELSSGEMSRGWACGDGIRPLQFSTVNGIDGFDDGVYFGGYLMNMSKAPVHIYRRKDVDQWEQVCSFPQGAINHVHNIVADPFRKCLWVFSGDFGEASAIWKVTENFKKVEHVAYNDQKFRACVAYALPEGLLYATDTPFADDFIYLLNPETMALKEVYPIHGSCIYGCKWKNGFAFSSTVEGDGREVSRWEFLFGRKRGSGIKDDYVHLYSGNLNEGFREIYKEKKDWLPFFTFQFGVFKFPSGENKNEGLYISPVATKNDGKLLKISEL